MNHRKKEEEEMWITDVDEFDRGVIFLKKLPKIDGNKSLIFYIKVNHSSIVRYWNINAKPSVTTFKSMQLYCPMILVYNPKRNRLIF